MSLPVILVHITLRCYSVTIRHTAASHKHIFIAIPIIVVGNSYGYVHVIIWKRFGVNRKTSFAIILVQAMLQLTTIGSYIITACSYIQIQITIFIRIKQ